MEFYTQNHQPICGIYLHTKCRSTETFLKAIQPFRENLVIGVECMFIKYINEQAR